MSYILDALKKADAERERRGVPGLNSRNVESDESAQAATLSWPTVIGAGLALLALGAAGMWWLARGDESPAPVEARVAPAVPPAPVAPPPAAPAIAAAPPAAQPASIPTVIVPPAPPKPVVAATPPAIAASAPERVPGYAELPPDIKARLGPLAVSGSVFSPEAARRMVIVNGQVLREGDQPAEGLAVERIGARATLLSYRGTRFELKH